MKIHNVEQGTDDWFKIKLGKMSASHAQAIGNQGKGLDTYTIDIVTQILTGINKSDYTNADLERGVAMESEARDIYAFEKEVEVKQVGFVEYNDYTGCSPDGIVNDDGLVEIKCPKDTMFTKLLISKKPDSAYVWQCQMQMLVTGFNWCDLVYYNPNFKNPLIIHELKRDEAMIAKLKDGLIMGEGLIKKYLKEVNNV